MIKIENKVTERVFEYIDAIAQQLGVAAEYVFTVLVRQQMIEGIVYGLFLLIANIAIGIVAIKIYKYTFCNWEKLCKRDNEFWILGCSATGLILLILIFYNVKFLLLYTLKTFNPEYYAIKEILGVFKQ